eukprot:scaffold742_cov165-Amphora_coffeaeformis.AAC.14
MIQAQNMLVTLSLVLVLARTCVEAAGGATICGPPSTKNEPIYFSGAPSVQAVARAWKTGYQNNCPDQMIQIEGDSSADGAARVCATRTGSLPVDVGGLSRPLYTAEAKTQNGWYYDCERSRRNTILVDVAVEGISFFTKLEDSVAQQCIALLGGLTKHHLRWMYSDYGETKLVEEGWDASSVPFSDGNDNTHLWSELHADCASQEILIAGEPDGSLVRKFFVDNVFQGDDENIATNRTNQYYASSSIPELVSFVETNGASITLFGLGYILQNGVRELLGTLDSVPIQNVNGDFTKPGFAAIEDSSYLLARRLYMSVLDDEESLAKTRPFFEFAFSHDGAELLKENGFWPVHEWEAMAMATRLQTLSARPLLDRARSTCGPKDGEISIAGSSTVFPVARAEIYQIGCGVDIIYEGGGSSAGAGRVCANLDKGSPVDIGDMSREWKTSEATEKNGFVYQCLKGDTDRSAIQIAVAVDGLTVAVKTGGIASRCIELLGGLSLSQLRWIFSSYSDEKLQETGWDATAVPYSDGDSNTHLWSELDSRCDALEIRISGPDDLSGTYEYFAETVLTDLEEGETFGYDRDLGYFNSAVDELLIKYVTENEEAITYFGYAYYAEYTDRLHAVPIENSQGDMVRPGDNSIRDGSYEPLSRSIYMNLLNDKQTLQHTVPFLEFGLASDDLVAVTGYLATPNKDEMQRRLSYSVSDDDDTTLSVGAIVGIAMGSVVVAGAVAFFAGRRSRSFRGGGKYGEQEQALP